MSFGGKQAQNVQGRKEDLIPIKNFVIRGSIKNIDYIVNYQILKLCKKKKFIQFGLRYHCMNFKGIKVTQDILS